MPHIDNTLLHHICINILYGALGLMVFVILERMIFYGMLGIKTQQMRSVLRRSSLSAGAAPYFPGRDVLSTSVMEFLNKQSREGGITRAQVEDLSSALFLRVSGKVNARLWLLDTIVTAAPLLGLLGTILGIMDTFDALSSGGISDPAAVSRGIAAALLATAIGIGTALLGLVAFNVLHRQADVITEGFKETLLTVTH
ncbi:MULTISPECIES: MotA/TolQ/ExbB proton channel family protein [unclassified Beijerinckia]|uniref:MotA/TolQ/ExbB proton channel family protein n=1 Tax=unclassified Beijerinckia TaxID=2638183 RepID=UPI00089C80A6|nr:MULTISPECIES: MotA/TolQ/ExbB proton channel family protein [unclassified Beijerinckia]MDH7794499.1 biopolymer transport protein ExbB [Beijerinckia sp. GAS462]SEB64452.1 outer membrane transport energization protein ExbB [Beijerinckia sp. 28-YEA-48]